MYLILANFSPCDQDTFTTGAIILRNGASGGLIIAGAVTAMQITSLVLFATSLMNNIHGVWSTIYGTCTELTTLVIGLSTFIIRRDAYEEGIFNISHNKELCIEQDINVCSLHGFYRVFRYTKVSAIFDFKCGCEFKHYGVNMRPRWRRYM